MLEEIVDVKVFGAYDLSDPVKSRISKKRVVKRMRCDTGTRLISSCDERGVQMLARAEIKEASYLRVEQYGQSSLK